MEPHPTHLFTQHLCWGTSEAKLPAGPTLFLSLPFRKSLLNPILVKISNILISFSASACLSLLSKFWLVCLSILWAVFPVPVLSIMIWIYLLRNKYLISSTFFQWSLALKNILNNRFFNQSWIPTKTKHSSLNKYSLKFVSTSADLITYQ